MFLYSHSICLSFILFCRQFTKVTRFMLHIPENILDPLEISPGQFSDCAQVIIHMIMFHLSIDTQVTSKSILLPSVDIAYASAETEQVSEYIKTRLSVM